MRRHNVSSLPSRGRGPRAAKPYEMTAECHELGADHPVLFVIQTRTRNMRRACSPVNVVVVAVAPSRRFA
jgi:hypothetical protein